MGFSLDPDAFPRAFSSASDIDVLIVDESLFDSIWFGILEWHYPQPLPLLPPASEWAKSRRYDVYWGCLRPASLSREGIQDSVRLRALRDISYQWFDAFQSLSRLAPFAAHKATGILYRTWRHALLYHVSGLAKIKSALKL